MLENYEETNLRLEVTEIILNIARVTNTLMKGTLTCTNINSYKHEICFFTTYMV